MSKCKEMNCGTTTGEHSPECLAEHAAAVAGGRFVKEASPVAGWKLTERDTIEAALDCLIRCQDQAFQSCECESCPQCGLMPDECTGTDCARTCQCSTCEHCLNDDSIKSLQELLAAPQPPSVGAVEVVAEVVNKYGDPEAFAERDLLRRTNIDKLKIGTELVDRQRITDLQSMVETERKFRLSAEAGWKQSISDLTARDQQIAELQARAAELEAMLRVSIDRVIAAKQESNHGE